MLKHGITYSVTGEGPASVRGDVLRVLTQNLSVDQDAEARFRWTYENAPVRGERVFVLRALDGSGVGTVVGTMGITARQFALAGRDVLAAIAGDFAVDADHRLLVPALQLARAARDDMVERFAFGYGFPNRKAELVMLHAGMRRLGTMTRFARVLHHAAYLARPPQRAGVPPVLAHAARLPWIAQSVGRLADLARAAVDAPGRARAASRYQLSWDARPDDRFDALWSAARREYDIVGARTSEFLAWRHGGAEFATLIRRSDRRLRAYAVIQLDQPNGVAHVRDLFGHLEDLGALVDLIVPALRDRGAASVSVRLLGAPRVTEALRSRGFTPRGEGRAVVLQRGRLDATLEAFVLDPDRWHLFDADEDS